MLGEASPLIDSVFSMEEAYRGEWVDRQFDFSKTAHHSKSKSLYGEIKQGRKKSKHRNIFSFIHVHTHNWAQALLGLKYTTIKNFL